jgi:Fe(3+) dicitrate transport protein
MTTSLLTRSRLRHSLLASASALMLGGLMMPLAAHGQSASTDEGAAENTVSPQATMMERVMVIGNADRVKEIPGSATFIEKKELEKANYSDVHRVLRRVPGVNIQEEEGFGNRPNISIRGGRSSRSADVTLMEDGVLVAPAPYAAPDAYYFPRVTRMDGVEVRKGSSTVQFGPRTTSGAINFLSAEIPEEETAKALLGYGTDNTQRAQFRYGRNTGQVGYVFDFGHEATDGFKDIDVVDADSGYNIQDGMLKLRFNTPDTATLYQSIELKFGATKEDSDETYLGLTDADFLADPFRRYAASQRDNMDAEHRTLQARHFFDTGKFDVTTTLYRNEFDRNWYRLNGLSIGGTRLSNLAALNNSTYLAALRGERNLSGSTGDTLWLRNNNREYISQGIQSDIGTSLTTGAVDHRLQGGIRFHYDEESRFQADDRYAIINGVTSLAARGAPGSQSNQLASAHATALYLQNEMLIGNWTIVPGARYEMIDLRLQNFNNGQDNSNEVNAFVPGIGISYDFTPAWQAFGGVHKGFAPPSPSSLDNREEESINYEAGLRYGAGPLTAEVTGFYIDYENLLSQCTTATGCDNLGIQYNGGKVEVKGIELSAEYDVASLTSLQGYRLPIMFAYTYTDATFKNSFVSNFSEWGTVRSGFELPYTPEHQFYLSAGFEAEKWSLTLAGKYIDEMRTVAGTGAIPAGQGTDASFIVDAYGDYEFYQNTRAFVTVQNLFDDIYIAARRPEGTRPGMPFTALAGVKYSF